MVSEWQYWPFTEPRVHSQKTAVADLSQNLLLMALGFLFNQDINLYYWFVVFYFLPTHRVSFGPGGALPILDDRSPSFILGSRRSLKETYGQRLPVRDLLGNVVLTF